MWDRDEIELAMIRELQHSGESSWTVLGKHERIRRARVAIFQHGRQHQPFYDSGMSYGDAFRFCYGQALEQRGSERPSVPAFSEAKLVGLDETDDGDDDSDA